MMRSDVTVELHIYMKQSNMEMKVTPRWLQTTPPTTSNEHRTSKVFATFIRTVKSYF